MALIPVYRVVNTIITFLENERPIYDTIIDSHYSGRKIKFFPGIRPTLAESDLPAIEVGPTQDQLEWAFVRVQSDTFNLEVHVTIPGKNFADALILDSKLVTLTQRILAWPPHLRAPIEGTNHWFYDSLPNSVDYGSANPKSNMRTSRITWSGKILEGFDNRAFPPYLQAGVVGNIP
jgi:hypothetical protein